MDSYNRRKTTSAARSRKTSAHMRSATYGTHHGVTPQAERMSRRRGNASHAALGNQRRARKATRGYVDQITPTATTGESSQAYSRRMNKRAFSEEVQHKSRVNRLAFFAIAIVLVLAAGFFAFQLAFFWSVDAKLSSTDEKLKTALTSPAEGAPYYVLLCADLNDVNGDDNIDAMLLVRLDEGQKKATAVAIPGNLKVVAGDSQVALSALLESAGPSAVVNNVASLANIDIAHFLHIDKEGFAYIVDALGGIEVNVEEAVDDPNAGSTYLAPGVQTLDGVSAAVYLNASNYKLGFQTKLACQRTFAKAMATRFFAESEGFGLEQDLDGIATHVNTDMGGREIIALFDKFKGLTGDDIFTAQLDGYESTISSHGYSATLFYPSSTNAAAIMAKVEAGEDPSALERKEEVKVDKESFEITVKNGSGITGGAGMIADILTNAGFQVAETGNADSYVYKETLIIYLDPEYADECEAVQQALGIGRVINGINGYVFDTEVMVVLGSDWKPLN